MKFIRFHSTYFTRTKYGHSATTAWTPLRCGIKFTEIALGRAKNDLRHRQQFNDLYLERLGTTTDLTAADQAEFFFAYQFFRNAVHAGLRKHVATRLWFLVPRENLPIHSAADKYMMRLRAETATHMRVVDSEDVLKEVNRIVKGDAELLQHFAEFATKYIVPPGT